MHFRAIGLLSFSSLVAYGCGGARIVPARDVALASATLETRAASRSAPREAPEVDPRLQAGDYVVYRFTGSFRQTSRAPLTLTERVLGREGSILALEIVMDDGAKKQTLHIHKDVTPGAAREVFDVTRVEAGNERPATVEAYEAMMAKTVFAADQNDEQLGIETTNVVVGGKTLTCKKTSYRVRVGKRAATMSTVASEAFPWGDVAGDITTLEGQLLYRVEVVDAGSRPRERDVGAVAVAP